MRLNGGPQTLTRKLDIADFAHAETGCLRKAFSAQMV